MTRQPYDQFSKQFLQELLSPLGEVEVNKEITDEVRQVDVLFSQTATSSQQVESLGLLGRIATSTSTALLEPFRNQPSKTEVRNCLLKLLYVIAHSQREAKREKTSLPEANLARLWILAPSASDNLLNSFAAKLELETWTNGVYLLPESLRTVIIAINELPITNDTLWLRILGKGETQRQAVSELLALPENNLLRENALKLITNWRIVIVQQQQSLTDEDRELIMNLSQAYQQWEQTTVQQGVQQERRQLMENLLKFKFGSVDEELARVIDSFLQLPADEFARFLLELPNLSREDLLERLDSQ
ncbi:Flagellar assembly protein H [Nostoc sp. DSM 114161]|jgi:hypothetical protein|uniref:hypothetical protein n=1 Tax=Nostoc sp. DSM 114161 TaxID=3440143 RepID=UPI004045FC3C